MKTQKEQVTALLKAIETGASEPIAYINADNYRQHNLTVADGLSGFGAALAVPEDVVGKNPASVVDEREHQLVVVAVFAFVRVNEYHVILPEYFIFKFQ